MVLRVLGYLLSQLAYELYSCKPSKYQDQVLKSLFKKIYFSGLILKKYYGCATQWFSKMFVPELFINNMKLQTV